MQNLIRTATVLVVFGASACSYLGTDPDGGGDPKPNQGEEIANPPQWWCRDRIDPNIELLSDVVDIGEDETGGDDDGGSVHPAEVETCVFAPVSDADADPWPGKPWWRGVPLVEHEPLDLVNAHPMYTREAVDEMTNQPTVIVAGDGHIRSGLIGNFAIWPFRTVPVSGLRPPIVTGTFFDALTAIKDPMIPTTMGDPFRSGRYNAYGQPCNSTSYIPDWFHSMIEDHVGSEPNALECAAMVTWQHADPIDNYPFPDSEDPAYDGTMRAAGATRCLDNGGQYLPGLAAVSMADRNGLLWLNWDELDQVKLWIGANIVGNELLATLMVALDLFELQGNESLYWPLNPAWPWSRWSYTGICAHPAELRMADNDITIKTWLGCPRGMHAVMPKIVDPPQQPDPNWKVEGFCTFPYQMPPSIGSAAPTVFPELKIGKPGHGFDGAIYIAPLTRETGLRWAESLQATPTTHGLQIHAVNDLGRALLHTVSVPDGAILRSMQGERLESDPIGVILQIDRQLAAGRLVSLWFEAPNGRTVLPRYLVPDDHITTDRLSEEARKHADEVAEKHLAERFAKTPFGPRLVELRTRRGWSREQLSEASQLDVATIEAIETEEISPDLTMLGRLWRGLGIRFFSELFKDRPQ